jgi:hypothetical protein
MARRRRRGLKHIDGVRLAALERALRGGDLELIPPLAAEALAKTRQGQRLLVSVIESRGSPELREYALYGFAWGERKAPILNLLLHVFENRLENPLVRGQAAEALGPRLHRLSPRQRQHRRYLRAIGAFVRSLDDPAPEVRFWSIFALAHPENAWLLPKLAQMENDQTMFPGWWTIRQEALWARNWILKQDLDCDPRTL